MIQNRYPGPAPFTSDQQSIFYGREEDKKALYQLIHLERIVVLYSKSGLGKSSLLSAGVIPKINSESVYNPIEIRFKAYNPKLPENPLEKAWDKITEGYNNKTFLKSIIPLKTSLWQAAKIRQFNEGSRHLILVFDQAEELFTYPDEDIQTFKHNLHELLKIKIPVSLRQMLDMFQRDQPEMLSDEEENALYEPLDIKLVFAIRSDRYHLLNKLADYFPNVQKNSYELKALKVKDARDAIVNPASEKGNFSSPPFTYKKEAVDTVLDFLKDKEGYVESIPLQILCESFEKKIKAEGLQVLNRENIGDIEAIIADYYEDKIKSLEIEQHQFLARKLIEEVLVLEEDQQRLSMHEAQISKLFSIPPKLLDDLVKSRLLRPEAASRGGYTYELSHDTLVPVVIKAKKIRKAEENRLAEIEAQKEKERENEALKANLKKQRIRAEQAEKKEKRYRRQRRWAIIFSMVAFSLAVFAIIKSISLNLEREKANDLTLLAEESKKDLKESYDSLSTINSQLDSSQKITKTLSDSLRIKNEEIKRNYLDLKKKTKRIVDFWLKEAEGLILNLNYEEAKKRIEDAAASCLNCDEVLNKLMEVAFYYNETGKAAEAEKLLTLVNSRIGNYRKFLPDNLKSNSSALMKIRAKLRSLNPTEYATLEQRYYPNMISVQGDNKINSFRIAQTETTLWQFSLFCKLDKQMISDNLKISDFLGENGKLEGHLPVVKVRWPQAVSYANWLSLRLDSFPLLSDDKTKRELGVFRLPKEEEWEFVASNRGSITGEPVGWFQYNSKGEAQKVGDSENVKPNLLGIYDMRGNVWEWCDDEFKGDDDFENSRILKGGSFSEDNSKITQNATEGTRSPEIGFRLVQSEI